MLKQVLPFLAFALPTLADSAPAPTPPPPPTLQPAPQPDVSMHTPQQTIASITLPPGYHLELIAAEPTIISPVCLAWDANGAMYVAEMRTYMLDINGKGTMEKKSRVSRFESTKNDGVYDKVTPFADNLLLPRMILPLDDRILIRETDTKDIKSYRDTNADGIADQITDFYKGGGQGGNLEHQPSGLIWNIDNYIYQTTLETRYRYTRGKWETSKTWNEFGQWGLAMDDTGKMFFSSAGYEKPCYDFQQPIIYGPMGQPDELANHFTRTYPALALPDVQGGPAMITPAGKLHHFTGCAGQSIYRGDALPEFYGDLFLPEPVGRLIRRAKVTNESGKTVVTNAYDQKEFLTSTDANFRPVWTATGPDGALYICDMYHGIIQESAWTNPGSYLRPVIQKYGLDKNINGGRIYRLVHDDSKLRKAPRMLEEKTADLLNHLADPNGWWRDTAQKLIVLRADKSVVPQLENLTKTHSNPLARLHALWTLEGLDATTPKLLIEKMADGDPRVRSAAIRIAEPLIKEDDATIIDALKSLATDKDPVVANQLILSILYTRPTEKTENAALDPTKDILAQTLRTHEKNAPVQATAKHWTDEVARKKAEEEKQKQAQLENAKKAAIVAKGKELYAQTCIACHGPDGKGVPVPEDEKNTLAPPLKGSQRLTSQDKSLPIKIVLHGLVGPNNNKTYPGEMASFAWADDTWLAATLTYARNEWGNKASIIEPQDIAKVRTQLATRKLPWTVEELTTEKPTDPVKK